MSESTSADAGAVPVPIPTPSSAEEAVTAVDGAPPAPALPEEAPPSTEEPVAASIPSAPVELAEAHTASSTVADAAATSSSDGVDSIAAGIRAAAIAPAAEDSHVRRQHVEQLAEEPRAEVTVIAPGYEQMLSSSKWEDLALPAEIIRGIYAKGWERPSKIQAQSLPYILRKDRPSLLAQAKNGSGKTGSFGLAMLAAVDPNVNRVQALCMSPTRELAIQTTRVLQQLAQFTSIQSVCVMGGVRYTQPITSHIVVATPGKIQDVLKSRLLDLSALRLFVLDEADDMIESFAGECMFVKRAASMGGRNPPQTLLFSASFECLEPSYPNALRAKNFTDQIIDRKPGVREPVVIRVASMEGLRLENVTHFVVKLRPQGNSEQAGFEAKLNFLLAMYDTMTVGKTMIFVATRAGANTLAQAMRQQGHQPSVITGAKEVPMEERVRIQEEFERGVTKVLICTDLMTRGIDVPGMKLVVNFDLPFEYSGHSHGPKVPDFATFQHRCGRVGRFGQIGAVINLISNAGDDTALGQLATHFALPVKELPADSPEESSIQVEEAMSAPRK